MAVRLGTLMFQAAAGQPAGQAAEQVTGPVGEGAQRGAFPGFQQLLDIHLVTLGEVTVTLGHLLAVLVLFAIGFLVSRTIQSVIARTMRRRGIEDEGLVGATQRLMHYAMLIIVGGYSLQIIGVNLRALFAAGAVAAVAVGFALQNILQNFVSGVIILMERSITPADILGIDGKMVRVEKMNIRTTVARTLDDEEIIIPNSVLVQSNVTNYTLSDERYRLRAPVGVVYSVDVDEVMKVLYKAAESVAERSSARDPVVQLKDFADSAIVFESSIWLDDPWTARTTKSIFNIAIWRALRAANITIAFPQMDVHLDGTVTQLGLPPD